MLLTQYEYDVEMVAGDKNYLSNALTREMAMFESEGRNSRNRKPVSEEKKLWEKYKSGDKTVGPLRDVPDHFKTTLKDEDQSEASNEEKLVKEFFLCPKETTSTYRSQGKRPASSSQTADAFKDLSKLVFKTDRLLAFKQKIIIDNIMHTFYEENKANLLQTLKALTEELYGFHKKDKIVQAENPTGDSKVLYLENPESESSNSSGVECCIYNSDSAILSNQVDQRSLGEFCAG
ncbi:hypothetical protein ACLB2K_030103 [Fragaria x ananassa]